MAARRTTFGKLERDRTKKARAAAKRERRQDRSSEVDAPDEPAPVVAPEVSRLSQAEIMERLRILHDRFDDGAVSFDDFEEQKAALLARLAVE